MLGLRWHFAVRARPIVQHIAPLVHARVPPKSLMPLAKRRVTAKPLGLTARLITE
jgi:hypothetical protein